MIKIELSAPEITLVLVNCIVVLSVMIYLISSKHKQEKPDNEDTDV